MIKREFSRALRAEASLARRRAKRDSEAMNTSLDHLPAGKRAELAFVVDVLRTSFADGRHASASKPDAILKIVMFGSYARGDWVEDPVGRYFSDYDLLVVVANEKHTDVFDYWEATEQRLLDELASGQHLRTPVNFIVHSMADVNAQLEQGRYFFVDILRDGIVLFEVPGHPFVDPQPLELAAALAVAEGHYEDWIPGAAERLVISALALERGFNSLAAFELHQAAEHLYNGLLLVKTLYTPKSHNLVRLRNLAEQIDPSLADIWPTQTKFQKRSFELLRAAYVKARYSRHYKVTAEELAWMRERIELLQAAVIRLCEARLAELRS